MNHLPLLNLKVRKYLREISLIVSLLTLTACVSLWPPLGSLSVRDAPPGKQDLPWNIRVCRIRAMQTWQVQGNLEVHAHSLRSANLSFSWKQTQTGYKLSLWGPLGQPHIQIIDNEVGAYFRINRGQIKQIKNAEIMIKQQLGINIPIRYFASWLRGAPAPHCKSERVLNGTSHLLKLHQAGWFVRYLCYNKIHYLDLPTQMIMSKGPWYIRVLVTHWTI